VRCVGGMDGTGIVRVNGIDNDASFNQVVQLNDE